MARKFWLDKQVENLSLVRFYSSALQGWVNLGRCADTKKYKEIKAALARKNKLIRKERISKELARFPWLSPKAAIIYLKTMALTRIFALILPFSCSHVIETFVEI